jgi:hypothetical protein
MGDKQGSVHEQTSGTVQEGPFCTVGLWYSAVRKYRSTVNSQGSSDFHCQFL